MMLALVAVLMILGPVCALLFIVAAPIFFGMMAYDVSTWPAEEYAEDVVELDARRSVAQPANSTQLTA